MSDNIIYYGETPCEAYFKSGKKKGTRCTNLAYYTKNGMNLCGVHCKAPREKLLVNPNKRAIEEQKLKEQYKIIKEYAERNKSEHKKGTVTVSKLRMMKKPEDKIGFLKVFPNFKHQHRKDGYGCAALSPKSIGPINHGMKNMPVAKNLENYHQFAKVFPFELDQENNILESSLVCRARGYEDTVPHRHKFSKQILKQNNATVPKFSCFYGKDGGERRYTYIQCRYFYCHWYEKLVVDLPEFKELLKMRGEGINLQIIGYDGYEPTLSLYEHYLDSSKPFGHEMVLYSLLVLDDSKDYPWNIYYEKHKELYEGVI